MKIIWVITISIFFLAFFINTLQKGNQPPFKKYTISFWMAQRYLAQWLNATCLNGSMLPVWMAQCYLAEWLNATCLNGSMLPGWMAQCYLAEWLNATWLNGSMLPVWMAQCYLSEWLNTNISLYIDKLGRPDTDQGNLINYENKAFNVNDVEFHLRRGCIFVNSQVLWVEKRHIKIITDPSPVVPNLHIPAFRHYIHASSIEVPLDG